jgi:hypothetical protein
LILLYQKTQQILKLLIIGLFFLSCENKNIYQQANNSSIAVKALKSTYERLEKRYKFGNIETYPIKNFSCPDLLNFNETRPNYLRCNRLYLECFLQGKTPSSFTHLTVSLENKDYRVVFEPAFSGAYSQTIARSLNGNPALPKYGVMVLATIPQLSKEKYPLIFENNCNQAKLQERVYEVLSFKDSSKKYFDTFGKQYLIDSYLVRNIDILEWKKLMGEKLKVKMPTNSDSFHLPATSLSLSQRKSYCEFRGKRLLESHIYDAATLLPKTIDPKEVPVRRSVFPWKSEENIFVELYEGRKISYGRKECNNVYTSECLVDEAYNGYLDLAATWSGVFETLGGYMESVSNIYEPRFNVIPSSFHFSAREFNLHQLGVRIHWDGEGSDLNSFNFIWNGNDYSKQVQDKDIKVGFRCMEEIAGEK